MGSNAGIHAARDVIYMNRTRAIGPEILRLRLHQRTLRDESLDPIRLLVAEDEQELTEEQSQHFPCEYEESEAAGEAPYWATWGF
jgi:hypothetical protein